MTILLDPVAANNWFVISAASKLARQHTIFTRLLGKEIAVWRDATNHLRVVDKDNYGREGAPEYRIQERYGFLWVSLGQPHKDMFELPEFNQPGRRFVDCGAFGVKASGLRIVENFLDMGHFPFVHTDILGKEPHTEVREYNVETRADTGEIWATGCSFWQPRAAASAVDGLHVEYTYRVVQPFASILYKTCPIREGERDVIGLYVQPLQEDECRANLWLLIYDEQHSDREIIDFQQSIFGQDKPILENQLPKLIPLDAKSEIPTRADAASIAYRRWLRQIGWQYGVQKAA
jgi:phenylpropionate dioxygenase-like ring-hydroxylating dioxygenase large terminal subunit